MQYAQITLDEAIELKRIGVINAVGLTYLYFQIKLRSGWEGTFDPTEVCKELGISKSSFYRCLSICKVEGYLDFEATGKLKVKNLKPSQGGGCLKTDTDCVKNGTAESKVGQPVSKLGKSCQKLENLVKTETASVKTETATPLEHAQGGTSGDSPYSYQINQISSSSINQENANPDDEDEDCKNIPVAEKPIKASKHKLAIKALASILEECSDDRQEWEKFFDWCEESLWPSFDEPVKNKIGWLKSIDPETDLTRLETNWINFTSQPDKNAPRTLTAPQAWQKVLGLAARLQFRQRTEQIISPHDEPQLFAATMAAGGLGKVAQAEGNELQKLKSAFVEQYKNFCPS